MQPTAMTRSLCILFAVALPSPAFAGPGSKLAAPAPAGVPERLAGPSETDPDKYKVVPDNERVRVFRYHDEPEAKTKLHHHDAFLLFALARFKRRLSFPDGTAKEREFKAGEV